MSDTEVAKRSARGSLILFLGNFLSSGILAVTIIVIARFLGPASYGEYTLSLVIPNILLIMVGLGVSSAITRFAAFHISRGEVAIASRFTRNGVLFLLIFGGALSIVNYVAAGYLSSAVLGRPDLTFFVQISSFLILGQTILQAASAGFVGWNSMVLASSAAVLQAILKLVISISLIIFGFAVLGAVSGQVLSYVVAGSISICALFFWRPGILRKKSAKNKGVSHSSFGADIKTMVSYDLPLFGGNTITGLASQYVTIILAAIAVNQVVGYYQAASNLTIIISITSTAVSLALFQAFSSLSGLKGEVGLAFRYAVKYVSFITTPIVVFLIAAAAPMMSIFYSSSYGSGVGYLRLLALSNLPIAFGLTVIGPFFSGIARTRLTLIYSLVGALTLVILAPVLSSVMHLGVNGLIYATLLSNIAEALVGVLIASKYIGANIDPKSTIMLLVASGIAFIPTYFVPQVFHSLVSLVIDAGIFFAVYFTVVPLLSAVDRTDIQRLSTAMEGFGIVGKVTRPILKYEGYLLDRVSKM